MTRSQFPGIDKLYHCIEYAGFSFWLTRAFFSLPIRRRISFFISILLVMGFGATDEWHQSFVKNRSPDIADWIADCVGAGLGALTLISCQKFWQWIQSKMLLAQNNDH